MKPTTTKPDLQLHPTALQALHDAVATNPDIAAPLAVLQTAVDRFESIRAKISDESAGNAAIAREAAARKDLVKTQAFLEIGQGTVDDVETARAELDAAKAGLEGLTGRKEVLSHELLKAQSEVATAEVVVTGALANWQQAVDDRACALVREGLDMIILAVSATLAAGNIYPSRPRYAADIYYVLDHYELQIPQSQPVHELPPLALEGIKLKERAQRAVSADIKLPQPDKPTPPVPQNGWSSQGIPQSLTHDALGNLLPEASSSWRVN